MKEENILKKVLLDICFREVQGGVSIEHIDKNDFLIKKIENMIINQSPKYPKDGPHLFVAEKTKLDYLLRTFEKNRRDLNIVNEQLRYLLEKQLINAMQVARLGYLKFNGFNINENNYRKISRDASRVGILVFSTFINKQLIDSTVDNESCVKSLITIAVVSKMLECSDLHRNIYIR